jgi:8-oxo-dGTP pyrophosphatase MutT (NUDIX family)
MEWKELGADNVFACPVFDVYRSRRVSPVGAEGDFYVLDLRDWVTVIPELTDDEGRDCFVMVEQYRHGSGQVTMEFPAGTVDRGEDAEEAGRRELLEETGYRARSMELLAGISPNPALMNNTTKIYLATDLNLMGGQNLDCNEEIRFHLIPVDEVVRRMGTGMYDNAIMMTALAFYLRRRGIAEQHSGKGV